MSFFSFFSFCCGERPKDEKVVTDAIVQTVQPVVCVPQEIEKMKCGVRVFRTGHFCRCMLCPRNGFHSSWQTQYDKKIDGKTIKRWGICTRCVARGHVRSQK